MRRMRRIMSLLVVFMLLFSSVAMAKGPSDSKKTPKAKASVKTEKVGMAEKAENEKTAGSKKSDSAGKLEASAEGETNSNLPENAAKGKQPQFVAEKKAYMAQVKELKKELKALTKSGYTAEELQQITDKATALEAQYPGVKAMPVESIISNKAKLKFDVPPVIKEGSMLIPVRAVTEGMGANVVWNQKEQSVTITKDGTEIVIKLGEGIATVSGTEVELGATAESFNNRTFVPLRFIAESLGLSVEWDEETQTVEIDEEELADEAESVQAPSDGEAAVEEPQTDGADTDESTETEQSVSGDTGVPSEIQQPAADEASADDILDQSVAVEVQP
ncbi:copper amine oxidase N-terminal domain-containing protein [Peptoclostridium acidaminophilum]|nr:copper amine oxidase N-terminal domain-containing protein [Peptoclostridium acidaminophilum]